MLPVLTKKCKICKEQESLIFLKAYCLSASYGFFLSCYSISKLKLC